MDNSNVSAIHSAMEMSLAKIKEEMEDHLESINCNTNEITSNYEYMCLLDARLAKVEEKLDQLLLASGVIPSSKYASFQMPKLAKSEREVFDYLMDQNAAISCRMLAFKLALTQTLLSDYITALIEKGIPIVKRYSGSEILVAIDVRFQHEMLGRIRSIQKVAVL